ncbi:MerR family transcriptional regulator [Flavobacterium aquariorum]|uniref:MerR family transcriptional regulator n=1 Tax=Flavobacterium aquariorum TaxID=2217670 RepID=A0A2W7TYT8_9FLAO|nr:chaperone modulator CbpM [Flavobacterium aquariorum]PZX94674.1 MerR family transcriptional regulator [Flavobacterium aquariorum]
MKTDNRILLQTISSYYQVELSFFNHLHDLGLLEIEIMEQSPYIHENQMHNLERMIRLHNELNVNPEGIDVVFNLLQKIDHLQKELIATNNRLRLFEN